ncbi:MAG: GNAT family N-acetyltransferase [Lachnospiraceae bacterium]|nr:GNAT family N-acetyltransferase [Lachnospiraceae bacterium]
MNLSKNTVPEPLFEVRTLKKDDMQGYAECMDSVWGQTYPNKIAYHPEQYMNAIENGRYYSVGSFSKDGEFAGHTSLWEWVNIPGVYELGMCAVKEKFRHNSMQERMVSACIEEAKKDNKKTALYTEAICDHPYSQKTFYKCGLRPCGFTLNHYPPDVLVSSFSDPKAYTSLCMLTLPLKKTRKTVYVPKELKCILEDIYKDCGYDRELLIDRTDSATGKSSSMITYSELLKSAGIIYYDLGSGSIKEFENYQKEIAEHGADVVHMHISLKAPGIADMYDAAKKSGFFFCGIIPDTEFGDMLYMEKMVNCEVEFDEIICSNETGPLLEIIKRFAGEAGCIHT